MAQSSWRFLYIARAFMAIRECWVTDRRKETQEEVVADLHSCLEHLAYRCSEMESKIDKCTKRAVYHMNLSKKESTPAGIARERARAKMYMLDRVRLQKENDKALGSMHMMQQQIDSIVSSHVDMVIVDDMRGFNATAARMALPQKASEIEKLGECLAERQIEAKNIQDAMGAFNSAITGRDSDDCSDADLMLMQELDELLLSPDHIIVASPAAAEKPLQQHHHIVELIQQEVCKENGDANSGESWDVTPVNSLFDPPGPRQHRRVQ